MSGADTSQHHEFRQRVRAWLDEHAPPKGSPQDFSMHYGALDGEDEERFIAKSRAWQAQLADAGLAGLSWPAEYGGQGAGQTEEFIFAQEQARYGVTTELFDVGVRMIGPTLIEHASEEQKRTLLPRILDGSEIWCQLYSEPLAGSDLAGVRTSAVLDGDEWVINGQKVWTSGAHYCRWGMLLARTDPSAPKHRGLTCFIVDMRAQGIEIRPIRQMTGVRHFCEVFLEDVRIPADAAFGEVGEGWPVVLTTLKHERAIIGGGHPGPSFEDIRELARAADPGLEWTSPDRLVDVYIGEQLIHLLDERVQAVLEAGQDATALASIKKLLHGELINRSVRLGLSLQRGFGMLEDSHFGREWAHEALKAPMYRIAGGTDEIQRNILATRILGLPR